VVAAINVRERVAVLHRVRNRYWLPLVLIMMCVFAGLVALTQDNAVAPLTHALSKSQPSSARIPRKTGIDTVRLAAR
jgi:hypothetical protein